MSRADRRAPPPRGRTRRRVRRSVRSGSPSIRDPDAPTQRPPTPADTRPHRQQAVCGVRSGVRLASQVGPGLGSGPVLLRSLPGSRCDRSGRCRPRDDDPRDARGTPTRRHDLSVGGRPARLPRGLAGPDGARPGCRPTARDHRSGRDHPARPGGRPLDRTRSDPDPGRRAMNQHPIETRRVMSTIG